MTFSETPASAPWIMFRLCYPINSLKRFELPTAPRTANPSIRSGHRSVHRTEETPHTLVFLFTLDFYIVAVERAVACIIKQTRSSRGTKLVRFSFHLQRRRARDNSYHSPDFALLSETPSLRSLTKQV